MCAPEQAGEERHPSFGERLLEHGSREPVDLHDEQTAASADGRGPETKPAHETIDEPLQSEDEVVEGHRFFDCIIGVE